MAEFKATYCPVIPKPTMEQIAAVAEARGVEPEVAAADLYNAREEAIAKMEQDPIRYGYIPPIWKVVWALMGVPWLDQTYARAMRKVLGFPHAVRTVLILGGNRSAKTRFSMFTLMHILLQFPKHRAWLFHSTHQQSVEYHQAPMYHLLPIELRGEKAIRSRWAYISWTQQMGFSGSKFVLPDRQECSFRNYSQDRTDAIEGGEIKGFGADELVPADWLVQLEMRLTTQDGWGVVGFTPLEGYSQTVRLFYDGAEPVKTVTGWLLPKDGGDPLPHLALGLSEAEYAEVAAAKAERTQHECPPCRPQNCDLWLEGKSGEPECPPGRVFETMPRVLRCRDPQRAIVHFVSSDNPFGGAPNVVTQCLGEGAVKTRTKFHGVAERTVAVKFPTFRRSVHVVAAEDVPEEGTNYLIVDPCSGRNMFMLWVRATPGVHYVYREWPGYYHIPGIGVPGPWAEASTSAKQLDGSRGEAQRTFGWGLCDYKREIARLEGWKCYRTDATVDEVKKWPDDGPADEMVEARFMDARFGNTQSFEEGGMVSLIETFDDFGLQFIDTATGGGKWTINDGVELITNALAYNVGKPVDFFNRPQLYISDACRNLIFAMETWTNEDGTTGACKDPVDCLRYYFLKGCEYVAPRGEAKGAGMGRGCY